MPIKLPNDLPAFDVLQSEGVSVMSEDQAARQDIRPLQIGLLNLMPKKIATETQFARLIGATPLQIDLTLIRMTEHQSKNTSADHMDEFYTSFQDIKERKFDGLVITGAPIEHLDFPDVSYWDEMTEVMDWTQTNVHSTFGVCWGGMAMINHFHGVEKHMLEAKAFGCFRHKRMSQDSPYLRGFSDDMVIPVSRWTEVRQNELDTADLKTLLASDQTGPCLVQDDAHRALYVFNHLTGGAATAIFSMATGSTKFTKRQILTSPKLVRNNDQKNRHNRRSWPCPNYRNSRLEKQPQRRRRRTRLPTPW